MDKMHKSMATYVKSLSKRAEGDDREKQLPGGHLGSTMVTHGEDFEPDSEFGNCLSCAFPLPLRPVHPLTATSSGSRKRATGTSPGDICCGRHHVLARGS
jgi:hypothetical protein